MNRPKTNTYRSYCEISGVDIIINSSISPKPWHLLFTTQVDIPILITCDEFKYRCRTFMDCLPSQFLRL